MNRLEIPWFFIAVLLHVNAYIIILDNYLPPYNHFQPTHCFPKNRALVFKKMEILIVEIDIQSETSKSNCQKN